MVYPLESGLECQQQTAGRCLIQKQNVRVSAILPDHVQFKSRVRLLPAIKFGTVKALGQVGGWDWSKLGASGLALLIAHRHHGAPTKTSEPRYFTAPTDCATRGLSSPIYPSLFPHQSGLYSCLAGVCDLSLNPVDDHGRPPYLNKSRRT